MAKVAEQANLNGSKYQERKLIQLSDINNNVEQHGKKAKFDSVVEITSDKMSLS